MNKSFLRIVVLAAGSLLTLNSYKAEAQAPAPTAGQAAAILGILGGLGVGAGFGIYYLVRAPHTVTGCVSDDGGTLQLARDGHRERYLLVGDTAAIKAGERVRISGKPGRDAAKREQFFVKNVSKQYGPCTAGAPSH